MKRDGEIRVEKIEGEEIRIDRDRSIRDRKVGADGFGTGGGGE